MIGQDVLIKVRADTNQAESKLGSLKRETDKTSTAMSKLGSAMGSAFSRGVDALGKMNQALEGTKKFLAVASKGLEAYAKQGGEAAAVVDRITASATKMQETLLSSIGKSVSAAEPLITGLGKVVEKLNEIGALGPVAIGALGLAISGNPYVAGLLALSTMSGDVGIGDVLKKGGVPGYMYGELKRRKTWGMYDDGVTVKDAGLVEDDVSVTSVGRPSSRPGAPAYVPPDRTFGAYYRTKLGFDPGDYNGDVGSALDSYMGAGSASGGRYSGAGVSDLDPAKIKEAADSLRELSADIADMGRTQSILERMLGPRTEFDAYAEGFTLIKGAASTAYDAIIAGEGLTTKALKGFFKESISGIGKRMLVRGLEEVAEGIAAASNPITAPTAAGHFIAAAKFGAGAVAAGLIASQIGGGGSSGGGYSPGAPNSSGGSAQQQAGTSAVIVYGDSFADAPPHERQLRATRMVERALGGRQTVRAA